MSDEKKGVLTLRLSDSERAIVSEMVETFTARGIPRTGSWSGAIRHLIKHFDTEAEVLDKLSEDLATAHEIGRASCRERV